MKHLLLTTIAAVVLVGCGSSVPDISIHDSAKAGDFEGIKQHIDAGVNVDLKDEIGFTPLHYVASIGQKEIAEYLIEKGADVNAKDKDGATPLHYAAPSTKSTTVVQLLLEKGADVNAKNKDGATPLDKLAQNWMTPTGDILRKHGGKTRKELEAVEPVAKASDISIHESAKEGNIEVVKQAIAAGTDINLKDDAYGGWTPLHYAVSEGQNEVAELLLSKGADVNAKHNRDGTPLHIAALFGQNKVAELLIAADADVNAKDKDGETPLDIATHPENPNSTAVFVALIRKHGGKYGKELKTAEPSAEAENSEADRMLFAHIIAAKNWNQWNINRIKIDFEDGADVNAKDAQGATPLHYPAYRGHTEIAELLISKGADLNTKDDNGETPLYQAEEVGLTHFGEVLTRKKETAALLRKHGAKHGSIHTAVEGGDIEGVKEFLATGTDVNAKNKFGETPLDLINGAKRKRAEIAELLRKHGGKHGTIHSAVGGRDVEAVKEFLAAGADVNVKDMRGFTPLHWASISAHKEAVELLIANGADVNAKGDGESTPLHYAAFNGHKEMVELLIASGADVNAKDKHGQTPLDRAIIHNHPETADLLRKHSGKTGDELKAEGK